MARMILLPLLLLLGLLSVSSAEKALLELDENGAVASVAALEFAAAAASMARTEIGDTAIAMKILMKDAVEQNDTISIESNEKEVSNK